MDKLYFITLEPHHIALSLTEGELYFLGEKIKDRIIEGRNLVALRDKFASEAELRKKLHPKDEPLRVELVGNKRGFYPYDIQCFRIETNSPSFSIRFQRLDILTKKEILDLNV